MIRIETLLASLAVEIAATIDRLFPDKLGHGATHEDGDTVPDFRQGLSISPRSSGYVQVVDSSALLDLAVQNDFIVNLTASPGTFVTECDPLMKVVSAKPLPEKAIVALREALVVGTERTPDQDLGVLDPADRRDRAALAVAGHQ